MGTDLEISFRRTPSLRRTSDVPLPSAQSPEQRQSATTASEQITNAAFQLLFAIAMLSFALGYYWQRYDPPITLKPGWVDAFG